MATTTMGSTNGTKRKISPAVYWAVGAVIIVALLFYAMNTRNIISTSPSVPSDTVTTPNTTNPSNATTYDNR